MDVIFCRNVLMYFAPEVREQALRFLFQSLSEGGWLIVSPSETAFVQQPGLNAVRFPGATLHRKGPPRKEDLDKIKPALSSPHPVPPAVASPPQPAKQGVAARGRRARGEEYKRIPAWRKTDIRPGEKSGKTPDKTKQEIYQEALSLYEKGRYEESAQELSKVLSKDQNEDNGFLLTPESMALMAKALANLGKLDQAKTWCEQAIHAEKLQPAHYYLLATIYQEQGHLGECMKSLKQTLYLDPEFVLAHFALGSFTKKRGKRDDSRKHLENARSLLLSMDPGDVLPHSDGMTAGRLREAIGLMIGD
jgi:chemotaxis protein methyltransferase CheR